MGVHVIKLPDVGEGVAEAELVEWMVKPGDNVMEDQILAAVMTDKATVEIPSPVIGKVTWLGAKVGDTVAVGSPIIKLDVDGAGNAKGDDAAPAKEAAKPAAKKEASAPLSRGAGEGPGVRADAQKSTGVKTPSPLTPLPQAGEGDRAVADAIRDHYAPKGADDDVPTAPVSVAVALADKLDTLVMFWAEGKKPTGSGDPFALRRAALGIIGCILNNAIRLELVDQFGDSLLQHRDLKKAQNAGKEPFAYLVAMKDFRGRPVDSRALDLLAFFHERLKIYLKDKGRRHDHIDAVLTRADGSPEDDLVLIVRKLDALEAFLKTEDGANLAAGYKRAANILKAEEKKGKLPDAAAVDEKRLAQSEERALFDALKAAEEKAAPAVAAEKFEAAMAALASLRPAVDAFFDKVTVNAEDASLRANRLALLQRFISAAAGVADLSKLEG
jgi:hypothetical protein